MSNTSETLPLGFADQVMELEIKLEEEETLELIQILSQMYRIAVDYYLEIDVKKATYFQKKLNNLSIKSLNAESITSPRKKADLQKNITNQMKNYQISQKTYIKAIVETNEKQTNKLIKKVEADLKKQQQNLSGRLMLRRVKSQTRLF